MTYDLDEAGYLQTRAKFAAMEQRLRALEQRTDLPAAHWSEARRSYLDMMRQYAREIKLYEAKHPPREDATSQSS
jgi:hypothetical protein